MDKIFTSILHKRYKRYKKLKLQQQRDIEKYLAMWRDYYEPGKTGEN